MWGERVNSSHVCDPINAASIRRVLFRLHFVQKLWLIYNWMKGKCEYAASTLGMWSIHFFVLSAHYSSLIGLVPRFRRSEFRTILRNEFLLAPCFFLSHSCMHNFLAQPPYRGKEQTQPDCLSDECRMCACAHQTQFIRFQWRCAANRMQYNDMMVGPVRSNNVSHLMNLP